MPGDLDRLLDHLNVLFPGQRRSTRRLVEQAVAQSSGGKTRKLISKSVRLFNKQVHLHVAFKWEREEVTHRSLIRERHSQLMIAIDVRLPAGSSR